MTELLLLGLSKKEQIEKSVREEVRNQEEIALFLKEINKGHASRLASVSVSVDVSKTLKTDRSAGYEQIYNTEGEKSE
ncbi:hypothetical protein OAO19_03025 [Gammaproteobacteria bacterium]|nr:hypothetical protein [Gammaproteobacteria bacterium]